MVAGLSRAASTIRSRNWPSDQRAPAPLRSGASVPWKLLLREGPGMAQQAKPDLPIGHDRAAARRIALRAGQRGRDRVADDRIGAQALLGERARRSTPAWPRAPSHVQADVTLLSQKLPPVIVLNQPFAKFASSSRVARGASAGLTPPAPGMSVSCPLVGRYTPATEIP